MCCPPACTCQCTGFALKKNNADLTPYTFSPSTAGPSFSQLLQLLRRQQRSVPADGNCQMHAIAFDLLVRAGASPEEVSEQQLAAKAAELRRLIAAALRANSVLQTLAGGEAAARRLAKQVEGMARSSGGKNTPPFYLPVCI